MSTATLTPTTVTAPVVDPAYALEVESPADAALVMFHAALLTLPVDAEVLDPSIRRDLIRVIKRTARLADRPLCDDERCVSPHVAPQSCCLGHVCADHHEDHDAECPEFAAELREEGDVL